MQSREKIVKSREKTSKGSKKTGKSREKIIALLSENGKLTAAGLAAEIGVTAKAIEKHLAKLKAEGIIEREGPKGGSWNISSESIICLGYLKSLHKSSVATDDLHPETATLFISYKSVEFPIFRT